MNNITSELKKLLVVLVAIAALAPFASAQEINGNTAKADYYANVKIELKGLSYQPSGGNYIFACYWKGRKNNLGDFSGGDGTNCNEITTSFVETNSYWTQVPSSGAYIANNRWNGNSQAAAQHTDNNEFKFYFFAKNYWDNKMAFKGWSDNPTGIPIVSQDQRYEMVFNSTSTSSSSPTYKTMYAVYLRSASTNKNDYTNFQTFLESITPSVSSLSWNNPNDVKSFNITGTNLINTEKRVISSSSSDNITKTVTATAPTEDFQVSKDGSTWANSVTYTSDGSALQTFTVHVKCTQSAAGTYTGNVSLTSEFCIPKSVSVSCSIVPPATLNLDEMDPTSLTDDEQGTVRISGSNLTGNVSVTVTDDDDFEIKTEEGINWASSASIPAANVNTGINLLVRIKPGKPIGIYDGTITATADNVSPSPTINISGTLSDNWYNAVTSEPEYYAADEIDSADDLAWFAKQGGGSGTLTADFSMAGHPWKPIANYTGTFNGNGHVITDLTNKIGDNVATTPGLFANITSGTVKNVFVKSCDFEGLNASGYYGIIANTMSSGTVTGCEVNGTVGGSGKWGGVVGQVTGGTVSSCISMVAPTGGGSLVYEGAVSNSYATVSGDLVKSGSMTCCYNRATQTFYNEGGSSTFDAPAFGYGKKGCESGGIRLIDKMTAGKWAQPVTTSINEGYPVLKLEDFNTMAEHDNFLYYGNINTLSLTGNILFYGKESNVTTTYSGDNLYIDEDAALKLASGVTVNAHTSRLIKNLPSRETEVWHHYSSPVANQSLGISYGQSGQVAWESSCNPSLQAGGFFPSDAENWDLYCFHEPAYHWINFKRNSSSHWYSENHTASIDYTNETKFAPGKGYLVALGESSYVQATGNLNHGTVEIPVTVSDLSATPGAKLQGVNLLGNPYQSYLSFQAFADGNRGLWNGTAATYLTYDPEGDYYTQGSTAIASSGSQASSDNLSMHQGFFIVSDKPVGNYTATFTDAMCSVNPEGDVHFRGEKFAYPLINLMVRDSEGVGDLAVVEFDRPEFAAAPKLFNYGGKGKVYFSYENEDDALLFLSEAIDQLPVHFDALEDAEYTLNWSTANADFSYLHLIDNITGADIDMLARNSYSFSATTRDYKSRFKLKFAYTGIGENEDTVLAEVFAFLHDGNLVVNGQGTIDIIDLNGRTICNQKLTGEQNTVGLPNVASGIYVVRLVNNSETKVQKIIVNK